MSLYFVVIKTYCTVYFIHIMVVRGSLLSSAVVVVVVIKKVVR